MSYNANDFLGGNFLKGDDLKESGPEVFTIEEVNQAEFDSRKKPGTKEKKLELVFTNGKKLTLNNTNVKTLVEAHGSKTDRWIGKDVVAYFDKDVMFGSKRVGGVRIRIPGGSSPDTEFP